MTKQIQCELFADYFQFYVADSCFKTDTGTIWDISSTDRLVATGTDLIAIGTARNMGVPVLVEIGSTPPEDDFADWQQVVDCSLAVPSGSIVLLGCTDYLPDALHEPVSEKHFAARVSFRGLDQLSDDGLDGEDIYRIQLWPGMGGPITVRKQRPAEILPLA